MKLRVLAVSLGTIRLDTLDKTIRPAAEPSSER